MAEKAEKAKKVPAFARVGRNIAKFLRDTRGEAKKMIWPTPRTVFKNTGVVLVTIVVIGLFVVGLDFVFVNLLSLIMSIAK